MTHAQAFALVAEHAPQEAGRLWNTTSHDGCDTANAVADQYGDDETEQAVADLKTLASGTTPDGWDEEIPSRTEKKTGVWMHGPSGQCKRVAAEATEEQATEKCADLNEQEQRENRGSGYYYVTDKP